MKGVRRNPNHTGFAIVFVIVMSEVAACLTSQNRPEPRAELGMRTEAAGFGASGVELTAADDFAKATQPPEPIRVWGMTNYNKMSCFRGESSVGARFSDGRCSTLR
jgi:hypothetical protein